jgi:hypothetical protein
MAINVSSISQISTVERTYACDFFLVIHWEESLKTIEVIEGVEKIAEEAGAEELERYWASPRVFRPSIEFENSASTNTILADNALRRYPRLDKVDGENYVKLTVRFNCIFRTSFDLRAFPFDTQELSINIKLRPPSSNIKILCVHSLLRKSKINMNHVEQTDFVMLPFPNMKTDTEGKYSSSSKFVLSFIAQRAWHRYVYNHICTTLCLQVLGWCVLFFKTSGEGDDRLELLFALLLTTVASKFAVSDDLPKLPFLTALDNYVLVSFFFLTFMAIEAAIIGTLTCPEERRHEIPLNFGEVSPEDARTIDVVAQVALFAMWCLFNLHHCYVGTSSVWRMDRERSENQNETHEKWKAIERDSERRKSQVVAPPTGGGGIFKKSMSIRISRKSMKGFKVTRSNTTKDTRVSPDVVAPTKSEMLRQSLADRKEKKEGRGQESGGAAESGEGVTEGPRIVALSGSVLSAPQTQELSQPDTPIVNENPSSGASPYTTARRVSRETQDAPRNLAVANRDSKS